MWFDSQAEEAANFYVSIFSDRPGSDGKNSRIVTVTRYGDAGAKAAGRPKGSVMTVVFELDGQKFLGLNGGPLFTFSPAISFIVNCETEQEVDWFWERLSAGGKDGPMRLAHRQDGVSWQIVPTVLGEMLQDKDPRKSERVMKAMLQMKKIEIKGLKQAYEQP